MNKEQIEEAVELMGIFVKSAYVAGVLDNGEASKDRLLKEMNFMAGFMSEYLEKFSSPFSTKGLKKQ